MRYYHAVTDTQYARRMIREAGPKNVLASWAYLRMKRDRGVGFIQHCRDNGVQSMFLDCGAYTAHMTGVEITLDDYYRGLDLLQPETYVALDVIGDPMGSAKNLERMVKDGYKPIPVFTRGAPWTELADMMSDFGYVAVGGFAGSGATRREMHLQLASVFRTISKVGPPAETKIHGFGISTPATMLAFPFYSTDSSGAVQTARFGQVVTAKFDGTIRQEHVNKHREARWKHAALAGAGEGGGKSFGDRLVFNCREYEKLGDHVTKVWRHRGLKWADDGWRDA